MSPNDLEATLAEIRELFRGMHEDLDWMKRRLRKLPTTFQWVYIQTVLIVAIFAAAFALLRYAPPL